MPDGLKKNAPPLTERPAQIRGRSGGDKITATVAEEKPTGSLPKPTGLKAYERGQRNAPKKSQTTIGISILGRYPIRPFMCLDTLSLSGVE